MAVGAARSERAAAGVPRALQRRPGASGRQPGRPAPRQRCPQRRRLLDGGGAPGQGNPICLSLQYGRRSLDVEARRLSQAANPLARTGDLGVVAMAAMVAPQVIARNEEARTASPLGPSALTASPPPQPRERSLAWLKSSRDGESGQEGPPSPAALSGLPTLRPAGAPAPAAVPTPPQPPQQKSVFGHRYEEPAPDDGGGAAATGPEPALDEAAVLARDAAGFAGRSNSESSDPGRMVGRSLDGTPQPAVYPPQRARSCPACCPHCPRSRAVPAGNAVYGRPAA